MNILFSNYSLINEKYITGKWNNRRYKIIECLGSGENGIVYLVQLNEKKYALKIGLSSYNLSYEIDVIKKLCGAQGKFLGLQIFDIDDYICSRSTYTFYVMPYIEGVTIYEYLQGKEPIEYLILFKKIVRKINIIHQKGYIYGDVKKEHILINKLTEDVNFIDFGGVTKFNHSIKQFTEIYDRGKWGIKNRKADPHYDLFSVAMLFFHISIGDNQFLKIYNQKNRIKKVCDIIQNIESLKYLRGVLKKIFLGYMTKSADVLEEIENHRNLLKPKKNYYKLVNTLFVTSLIFFIIIAILFFKEIS